MGQHQQIDSGVYKKYCFSLEWKYQVLSQKEDGE